MAQCTVVWKILTTMVFNNDYQFHAKDKQFDRKKGQYARGLLRNWVKLRSELGHEQFLKLRVWSQPAAWADEVVGHNATHNVSTSVLHELATLVDLITCQFNNHILYTSGQSHI